MPIVVKFELSREAGSDELYPTMESNLRTPGDEGLFVLSCLAGEFNPSFLSTFQPLVASNNDWEIWGEIVYFVREGESIYLSQSPHHFEDLEEYVELSVDQFRRILSDFEQFMDDRVEFERAY